MNGKNASSRIQAPLHAPNARFGNVRFGRRVVVGTPEEPFNQGRSFLQVAQVLPLIKPRQPSGAAVWSNVTGAISVTHSGASANQSADCGLELGSAGHDVAIDVTCKLSGRG